MIRLMLFLCALLLPLAAQADDDARCRHSAPRQLDLDIEGVRSVMFQVGPHKLRLQAAPGAAAIHGRACASGEGWLDDLKVEQERDGDRLLVRLHRGRELRGIFLGRSHAYLEMEGTVPEDVLVQLVVGGGDAWLTGASAMSADVGSGDVEVRRIAGLATVKVGSGDIGLDEVGSLHVLAIGSGDVEAARVREGLEVGSIGSGDLVVRGVGGDATIRSIGSGDAELHDVGGSVSIGSIGSGDADLRNVGGSVTVDGIGSGDLDARDVRGDLTVNGKGSGSVRHEGVAGKVDVPSRR